MKAKIFLVINYVFLTIMAIFALFPLIQVLLNSFRSDSEVKSMPIGLPKEWVLYNYRDTWNIGGYGRAYINSLIIGGLTILFVLVLVGLGAYALTRMQFKMREFFIAYFFIAISIPGFLYIVPVYFTMNKLGILDTRLGLIIVYTAMQIPFNMLLLRNFLAGIPRELEEAAKIDGCNELSTFIRITVPIAKPIFLTIALLIFVSTWNEFLWSNTFIITDELKTVATRFVKFTGQYASNMARIYTGSVLTITPVVALYLIFSRRFIEGMTSGSIKA